MVTVMGEDRTGALIAQYEATLRPLGWQKEYDSAGFRGGPTDEQVASGFERSMLVHHQGATGYFRFIKGGAHSTPHNDFFAVVYKAIKSSNPGDGNIWAIRDAI